jgi:hypothetical protein
LKGFLELGAVNRQYGNYTDPSGNFRIGDHTDITSKKPGFQDLVKM